MNIDKDAFSNGQIDSKLWLCRELENLFDKIDTIWVYGGWYGITAFLLRSRNNIQIQKIHSYDLDTSCQSVADMINENWVIKNWQFKAFTKDCNDLHPNINEVDLIINTSTEHFDSMQWWDNIPKGTYVALQGNNMPHDDHCVYSANLSEFCSRYPLTETSYKGTLDFHYPTWEFTRFMTIGMK